MTFSGVKVVSAKSRSGDVTDAIVLSSSNPSALTVPASVNFAAGSNTVTFMATVVSLTNGSSTIIASNTATGVWAEYNVHPHVSTEGPDFGSDLHLVAGDLVFTIPAGYTLYSIEGADCALVSGDWVWQTLEGTDYQVDGNQVTVFSEAGGRLVIRIRLTPAP